MSKMEYMAAESYMNDAFDAYVPNKGKADTLYGELVRATNRIGYRYYNDGDILGTGYGRETCNPAGRFILTHVTNKEVTAILNDMWGMESETAYEAVLKSFIIAMCEYLEENKEMLLSKETTDMLDSRDPHMDVDYTPMWDEDDEY